MPLMTPQYRYGAVVEIERVHDGERSFAIEERPCLHNDNTVINGNRYTRLGPGWPARLFAPGFLDCTGWVPYDSALEAITGVAVDWDVCPLCGKDEDDSAPVPGYLPGLCVECDHAEAGQVIRMLDTIRKMSAEERTDPSVKREIESAEDRLKELLP